MLRGSGREGVEAGGGVSVGDDGDLDLIALDGGYGEADAFDGDGSLGDDVAGECVGQPDVEAPVCFGRVRCNGSEGDEGGGAVDVALHDVAAEGRSGWGGEFKIDDGVGP